MQSYYFSNYKAKLEEIKQVQFYLNISDLANIE